MQVSGLCGRLKLFQTNMKTQELFDDLPTERFLMSIESIRFVVGLLHDWI